MVERETGESLKCIRTDNGGEYIDQTIKDLDKEAQINLGDRGLVELDSNDEDETTSTSNMSNGTTKFGVCNDIVVDDFIEEDRSSNEEEEVHGFQEIGAEFNVQESKQVAHDLSSAERVETRLAVRVLTRAWVPSLRYSPDERKKESLGPRYNARLVVKGYEKKEGIDFEEIFPPLRTFCCLSAPTASFQLATTASLHPSNWVQQALNLNLCLIAPPLRVFQTSKTGMWSDLLVDKCFTSESLKSSCQEGVTKLYPDGLRSY
ncbi:hypothetical protein LIER_30941 [Lithospermum erythrorhizon]|uniref:Retrovirus-related Pol polyprotein from transposon TNT 1-94 n=1 Tax=Lithospermum erythrorhizon TaxID=34254 RepID=A0AAV3RVA2_LITER